MNRKNIQRHLKKKIEKWTNTIEDKELVKLIHRDIVVTGGCIPSLLTGDEVNDYDVYFSTKSTTLKVAKHYVTQWKKSHTQQDIHVFKDKEDFETYIGRKVVEYIAKDKETNFEDDENLDPVAIEGIIRGVVGEYFDDRVTIYVPSSGVVGKVVDYHDLSVFENGRGFNRDNKPTNEEEVKKFDVYEPVFMSSNAITLSDDIQIIVRFFGEPAEIHANFDFLHATSYYTNGELHTTTEILEAIINKELIYRGSKYPLCSIVRMRKFITRGWTISAGQILKVCMNLQDFNLNDISVLQSQLFGVDAYYFHHLIGMIKQDLADGTISDIEGTYVAELVDKLF